MIFTPIAATLFLFSGLLWLGVIDARTRHLPDLITIPLIAVGLIYQTLTSDSAWTYFLATVIAYASFVGIEFGYRHLRGQNGLGRGDAKLFAVGGSWCGLLALPYIVLIASLSALLVLLIGKMVLSKSVRLTTSTPFGPYLGAGIAVCWAFKAQLS
jgi:leader peptidase (prepilin peptidase)/N-methyltransferase